MREANAQGEIIILKDTDVAELDKVEYIKENSRNLRGSLAASLKEGGDGFSDDDKNLLKFHGMYQQMIRGKGSEDEERTHTIMLRGRIPGGRLTAKQYLAWDELGDKFGGKALRLTTRQSIQLHGVLKGNLKEIVRKLQEISLSTMGACGDVVRNVTQAVNPNGDIKLNKLDAVASLLSDHFKFKSRAYAEIWLDEEPIQEEEPVDSIYGKTYLPRKFKIAVTAAGNNSIDIYTNDMAFTATFTGSDEIEGYFVFAGGGLGMTHKKSETFPRKADCIGWIEASSLISVSEAIVASHRDYGDRTNRKHARLKYVLHEKGVDWFREEVEKRAGIKFQNRKLPEWNTPLYLGWHERSDGTLALGFHTLSGRIKDFENKPLKSALKEIIGKYNLDVQITADQDLILLGINRTDKEPILNRLKELNVAPNSPSVLFNRALACPALPTCGLALTESERSLPSTLEAIQVLLDKYDLMHKAPIIRMTGCPNGCARPYTAEIGIVGQQSGGKYAIFLGGDHEGTRIGFQVSEKTSIADLSVMLDKLFSEWKNAPSEQRFGDFINQIGKERSKQIITE